MQSGSSKGQQKPEQPKKQVPVQKGGVKKPQAQRQGPGAGTGPGRGRGEQQRGRGSQRGGRMGDRSGRGRENGREQFPSSRPTSRHGTPPLSGGTALLPSLLATFCHTSADVYLGWIVTVVALLLLCNGKTLLRTPLHPH